MSVLPEPETFAPRISQRDASSTRMLPDLERYPDGGLSVYVQKDSPGKDKESNWLPAPDGPFWMAMRISWPKTEALDGT